MCEPQPGFSLLDPFCGGGTIPLEASEMLAGGWGGASALGGTLFGCDKSEVVVKGAQVAEAPPLKPRPAFQCDITPRLEGFEGTSGPQQCAGGSDVDGMVLAGQRRCSWNNKCCI